MYNEKAIIDNILEVYDCCSVDDILKGKEWYNTANMLCVDIAKRYNRHPVTVMGVLAALSPLSSWDMNLLNTDLYFQGIHKHTGTQIQKCQQIERTRDDKKISEVLNGKKTVSFFNNILSPYANEYVTIDRHSLSVAGIDSNSCTKKQYSFLSDCYKQAAHQVGLKGLHLQAATWVYFRKAKKK